MMEIVPYPGKMLNLKTMQIYALDQDKPILASEADRKKSYLCPECREILRVRGGFQRQLHFYHIRLSSNCRQSQKSAIHLKIQEFLYHLLPRGDAQLERSFPQKGRIADVAWESNKIIFEIQCSPISMQEVKSRTEDYQSLGYEVVWILHDWRYNRRRLTAAELYLHKKNRYFTNLNSNGRGFIYDQLQFYNRGLRSFRGPPLKVDLSRPFRVQRELRASIDERTLYFANDLLSNPSLNLDPPQPSLPFSLKREAIRLYTQFLHLLLERASK